MWNTQTPWAFILLLFISISLSAQSNLKSKENHKDIIQKAQNLTLSQERDQAIQILIRAIENENLNKKVHEELLKTLDEVTTLFYTERSQKLYEYGKTLSREAPAEAMEKFKECLTVEPGNIQTYLQMARLSLFMGRCDEAEASVTRGLLVNPHSSELLLLNLQVKACLQKNSEIEKSLEKLSEVQKKMPLYYHTTIAQYFYNKGDFLRAQVELQKAIAIDNAYPEIYYWETLVQRKLSLGSTSTGLRYVRLCKTFTKKDYKKYEYEPRVCQQLKSFESELNNELQKEEKQNI